MGKKAGTKKKKMNKKNKNPNLDGFMRVSHLQKCAFLMKDLTFQVSHPTPFEDLVGG